jgi:cellulose synthase/poly-beta-1,6-N-acetylglucosamine synthase-like glycosyltransferase
MYFAGGHHGFEEAPAPPLTIAGDGAQVLPRLDREALCGMLTRLPPDDLAETLRTRLLPIVSLPGMVLHAACGAAALEEGHARGLKIVATAETQDFLAAVRGVHGQFLLREATLGLAWRLPEFSARQRLTPQQAILFMAAASLIAVGAMVLPVEHSWFIASCAGGLFFLSVVALRLLCLLPEVPRQRQPCGPPLREADLPVYSVLVPLFRERAVLPQLIQALGSFSYPPDKLDIKLILEEEDMLMQAAVAALDLPPQFEVIVVPAGRPQTKPRAMDYALPFCRGTLLTIYDAEDIPEPGQLRKAAERFLRAGPDLACLQAKLTFFNSGENWLTRQFTAEYAMLFGRLLPVLAAHRLPLPLGGTSNHFRTEVLRRVGAWDPYNVTEDADLGIRLARFGYDTGTLDSFTDEEANTRLGNWMRQRARWLKGFLATWLVHMRHPLRLMREVGPAGFWVIQAATLGVFASSLLHPLCLIAMLWVAVSETAAPGRTGLIFVVMAGVNLLVFVAGYLLSILLARQALRQHAITGWHGTLASMPIYWLLMSAAAWLALWQFVTQPFQWNKTEHGLSRVQGSIPPPRRWWFRRAAPRGSG